MSFARMEYINTTFGIIVLAGGFLKGILESIHVKRNNLKEHEMTSSYLAIKPIFDNYNSIYKTFANALVTLIYICVILFILLNWNSIWSALKLIHSLP